MSSWQRLALRLEQFKQKLRELIAFDSRVLKHLAAAGGMTASLVYRLLGQRDRAFRVSATIHRGAYAKWAARAVEGQIRHDLHTARQGPLLDVFRRHVERLAPSPNTARFFEDPERMLGTRLLVLKSPRESEKGAILIDYSFFFPLFANFYDLNAVARRYHLVLEPSWSGLCELDVLCFLAYDMPVFVQSYEPRDGEFLRRIGSNLIPVPVAGNWWVDHRTFRPLPGVAKDADVVLIASWAPFKRHERVFAALAQLRARGERLKVILLGYPNAYTKDDIYRLARHHGVDDQLEMYERVGPEEVNRHLNRAKVNLVWSRLEGINRAIIEGFFSGTPGILRAGFNYGYVYPYINGQTGCFANEDELPDKLLWVIRNQERFTPRHWVMENMTCQTATRIIDEVIGQYARRAGESWSGGLAVKVSQLDAQHYWDESERRRFEGDYAFLRGCRRQR